MTSNTESGIRALIEQVADGTDDVLLSRPALEFLAPGDDLWRYSPENLAAVAERDFYPPFGPTLLGSFQQWRELGRFPLGGTPPLDVRVPVEADQQRFLGGRATGGLADPSGQTRGEWLWDVEQTVGRPMPPPPLVRLDPHENARKLFVALSDLVHELGFSIKVLHSQRGLNEGGTHHKERRIEIAGWLNSTEQAAILAHETFHAFLHGPDDPIGAKYGSEIGARSLAELEVEIGTHVVLAAHGIDSTARARYAIAFWTEQIRTELSAVNADRPVPSRSAIARAIPGRVSAVAQTIMAASEALTGDPRTAPDSLRQRLHTPADLEAAGYRPHPPRSGPGLS